MNPQTNPFSRSIDLSKNLFAQTLSGMEELLTLGLDHTQEFVGRSTQQLKGALADPIVVDEASQWPDAMQQSMRTTLNLFRDTAQAATDYQVDSLRLLHNQAAEAQKSIAAAIYAQFEMVDQAVASTKRGSKTAVSSQKVSA